jgi:predicted transcriptional regulator
MPNRSYEKGRRFENHVAKFFRGIFGHFGVANRSFMSRGADVTFVDYLLRVWRVSCKCMKLPKKIWDELESHDIVAIHQDRKEKAYVILEGKFKELCTRGLSEYVELTDEGKQAVEDIENQYVPNGTEGC